MPEVEMAVQDNPAEGATPDANIMDGSTPVLDNVQTKESLILGKFKSVDDIAKGYTEVEKEKGRLADEVGKLRAESESLKHKAELREILSSLTEANKPKPEVMDLRTYAAKLAPKFQDNPEEAIMELMAINNNWLKQSEDKTGSNLSAAEKRIAELSASLDEKLERLSPDYQQNKELIDSLTDGGMSLAKAKAWVKAHNLSTTSDEQTPIQRTNPPASITPTRSTGQDSKPPSAYMWSKDQLPQLAEIYPELDAKQLEVKMNELNATRQSRINAGQPARKTITRGER